MRGLKVVLGGFLGAWVAGIFEKDERMSVFFFIFLDVFSLFCIIDEFIGKLLGKNVT